jgi:Uma2 family endonuclease
MTVEELLALPDDNVDRWLVAGVMKEKPWSPKDRFHGRVLTRVACSLDNWLDNQPRPRGETLGGSVGVILQRDPDTAVGVDVAYISDAVLRNQTCDAEFIDGIPTLAVEILSPNDTFEEVNEKIDTYLAAGVPIVWVIDPSRRTVTVYRPDTEPELFTVRSELAAEPHLPGFRVPVARLFE